MGEFDVTSKHLIEGHPRDWVAMAKLPLPPEAKLSVVDADLSTLTTAADKLIRVDHGAGSYMAHIEFQSGPDPNLDQRVLVYNVLARWRHRLPVRSVVFLLRQEARTPGTTGGFSDSAGSSSQLHFTYELIRVWELPVESVLTGGIGTLPLAPICDVEKPGLPAVVDRMRKRLDAEAARDDARELWTAAKILMGLRYQEATIELLLQGAANMQESVTYQSIKREGRVQGRAEGMLAGELRTLILQGTRLFGTPSAAVLARLNAITDTAELDRLSLGIFTAGGWEQLLG